MQKADVRITSGCVVESTMFLRTAFGGGRRFNKAASSVAVGRRPTVPGAGFTLIELLTVVVIIGILVSLIMAGVVEMKNRARKKHEQATIAALTTAIRAYRTEYGRWPCPDPAVGGTWTNNDNYVIIDGYLLSTGSGNPRRRTFWEASGTVTNPYTRRPFSITINTAANTLTIQ